MVFDALHRVPQIQQTSGLVALFQQTHQAAAQQGRAREIWLAFLRPEEENRGTVGRFGESGVEAHQVVLDLNGRHPSKSLRCCSRVAGGTAPTPRFSVTCAAWLMPARDRKSVV